MRYNRQNSSDRVREGIRILLVQPEYYTRYPPLGLLKLCSLYKASGHEVFFVRGCRPAPWVPHTICITSLFTFSWASVHRTVEYYRALYPKADLVLGGIYATLMPEHANLSGANRVHEGLVDEAECHRPDYSLAQGWDSSIVFGMRGCVRRCAFCAVPRLEGEARPVDKPIADLVEASHRKIILWDNNILGIARWEGLIAQLRDLDVEVDFNQGLDARLINDDVAQKIGGLRINPIRMAYDTPYEYGALQRAIPALEAAGFKRRRMIVYTLYNFTDTPEDFLRRVVNLLSWGVVCYPMRYEPLNSLVKNKYVSPHWTARQLEMVARARRVLGYGGAFPPYRALLDKFQNGTSFDSAFALRPGPRRRNEPLGVAGIVQESSSSLAKGRIRFRELFKDPIRLLATVSCESCGQKLEVGDPAFALQDYEGRYAGYVCSLCHPDRDMINGVWRSALGSIHMAGEWQFDPTPVVLANTGDS